MREFNELKDRCRRFLPKLDKELEKERPRMEEEFKKVLHTVLTKFKKFKIYAERLVQKHMYYDTANLLPAKDKDEINVGFSVLYKKFKFTLTVKNLMDKHFEDFNGYPMPGRAIFATLQYNF